MALCRVNTDNLKELSYACTDFVPIELIHILFSALWGGLEPPTITRYMYRSNQLNYQR